MAVTIYKHLVKFKITVYKLNCLQFQNHVQYIAAHYACIHICHCCIYAMLSEVCKFAVAKMQHWSIIKHDIIEVSLEKHLQ